MQLKGSTSENMKISATLSRLALHFWRPDFTPIQAQYLMEDYLEDLRGYSSNQVESACRNYRRDPENKFFPTPGQLIDLIPRASPFTSPAEIEGQRKAAEKAYGKT